MNSVFCNSLVDNVKIVRHVWHSGQARVEFSSGGKAVYLVTGLK